MNMLNPFTAAFEASLVEDPRVLSKDSVEDLTNYEPAGWLAWTGSGSDPILGNRVVACVRCACLVADTPQSRTAHDGFHQKLEPPKPRCICGDEVVHGCPEHGPKGL